MNDLALRVAARYSKIAYNPASVFQSVKSALRYTHPGQDEGDLDSFADDVVASLVKGFSDLLVDPLKKAKITSYGPRETETATYENSASRSRNYSYWASVEYPSRVGLTYVMNVDLKRRWNEAVQSGRRTPHTVTPPINPGLLSEIQDLLVEIAEGLLPKDLAPDEVETFSVQLYGDERRGIETKASSSVSSDSKSEELNETFDVDARFRFELEADKAKITATAQGDKVQVRIEVPVRLTFRGIRSPWSSNYMSER